MGYLENIINDRKLVPHCSMRMEKLHFVFLDLKIMIYRFLIKCGKSRCRFFIN
ncbi:hypothetical protein L3X37_12635 [Sabulilitoribacter arenilitoris]|uniref:Uncharacterized protein n=1 Tax=Wocania arenilitoris TaxID=2044858 RepID=A0AAE3EQQ9_9FLAO|nr:hypothetical protein [Wocania arenilitoris]